MSESLRRIAAIVKADFWIRFRRTSTLSIFLILCIMAYLWIPVPSSGKALIQVEGQRALYNSVALSMATSVLCTLLLSLAGFYMVSSTIRRDIRARTGFIIASTTMKNSEYIFGKFLGNVVFLSAVVGGFMVSCMGMQLLRGEAPLEPFTFLQMYLLVAPPAIIFVSAIALAFESMRFLSGKFGDIVYFFVWMLTISVVAANTKGTDGHWSSYMDVTGLGFILQEFKHIADVDQMSIGSSPYDITKAPLVLPHITVHANILIPRLVTMFLSIPFLFVALLFFHRFNPARLKTSAQKAHQGWIERINRWLKPITRRLLAFVPAPGSSASFGRSILSDALLTLQLSPMAVVLIAGFGVFSLFRPVNSIMGGVLPAIFAVLGVLLSDISTRERASGLAGVVFGSPNLKPKFVAWKFASTFLVVLLFIAVPFTRVILVHPSAALSLVIGGALTAAGATALGIMSSNPKAFVAVFLMFWYICVSAMKEPTFDFAGFSGNATPSVQLTYSLVAAMMLVAAELTHRIQLKRNY